MILEVLKHAVVFMLDIAPYMVLGLAFVGLLHVFVSKQFVANHIGHNNLLSSIKATLLGVPLPLCSCGVIPTAVYFSKNGASRGAVIAFLISTPQTGVDSIIATYGMLGPVFALFRPLAAFVSGITGGLIASFFTRGETLTLTLIEDEDTHSSEGGCSGGSCTLEPIKKSKLRSIYEYAFVEFLDDIVLQFIAGVVLAALISYFIPADFFVRYGVASGAAGMVVMILLGIPMYVCATASIPIALALLSKGVSPGAVFVFLAVGPMTNAASITVLYKILKGKMMAVYLLSGTLFAVLFGLLLDKIFAITEFSIPIVALSEHHDSISPSWPVLTLTLLFTALLLLSLIRKLKLRIKKGDRYENRTNCKN